MIDSYRIDGNLLLLLGIANDFFEKKLPEPVNPLVNCLLKTIKSGCVKPFLYMYG
jgi:hypothetical protein